MTVIQVICLYHKEIQMSLCAMMSVNFIINCVNDGENCCMTVFEVTPGGRLSDRKAADSLSNTKQIIEERMRT